MKKDNEHSNNQQLELTILAGNPAPHDSENMLQIIQAKYERHITCSYQELFDNFDELHALTYSVGVKQVEDVMQYFKRGEVIIGSPSQIHGDLAHMLAKQQYDIGYFSHNMELQKRIEDETFRFYVTTGSHGKIYLLEADDGRRRVIMGSANFSRQAWDGSQVECYICIDDSNLFNYYMDLFAAIRQDSSYEIGKDAEELRPDGSNLEKLPVIHKIVKTNQAVVIHDVPNNEEIEYATQITADTKKFAKWLESVKIDADKKKSLLLLPKHVARLKQISRQEHDERTKKMVINPEFRIDYCKKTATFADKPLNLYPSPDDVSSDIQCILDYMKGTESFTGNTVELRSIYWKVMIYMFISPFIAILRYHYRNIAPINSVGKAFPMYMILRGPKNGGKSSIVKTIQYLMFGQPLGTLPAEVVSPKIFEEYKLQVKGCPVLIDDVNNRRFKYFKDIVKNENSLFLAHVLDHGCFILTTNEAEKILPEISKRSIIFHIHNQLTDDAAMKKDISLYTMQKHMGTAFYRAYIQRMIPEVQKLLTLLDRDEFDDPEWLPDIFRSASQTMIDIITEQGFEKPTELNPFDWKDFMGESIKSEKSVNILRQAYAIAPQLFRVEKKEDLLFIDLKEANMTPMDIDALKNELPVSAECRLIGFTLQVKWSIIKRYAGIDFLSDNTILAKFSHWLRRD